MDPLVEVNEKHRRAARWCETCADVTPHWGGGYPPSGRLLIFTCIVCRQSSYVKRGVGCWIAQWKPDYDHLEGGH